MSRHRIKGSGEGARHGNPAYVPEEVQTHIRVEIECCEELLDHSKFRLAEINAAIQEATRQGDDYSPNDDHSIIWCGSLRGLHRERREKEESCRELDDKIEILQRLAQDSRMKDVYRILANVFFDDEDRERKIDLFIHAAWRAKENYSNCLNKLKSANDLADKIARAAEGLANLYRELEETGVYVPEELCSIRELLQTTDNTGLPSYMADSWRLRRYAVLGNLPRPISEQEFIEQWSRSEQVSKIPSDDPQEKARRAVLRGWQVAPGLAELLDTAAKAAREFEPQEYGHIGAAISSGQLSVKRPYLRAFRELLAEHFSFPLPKGLMHAAAGVADVAINHPDVNFSHDDVRKVLV
jgi:hypothetical protein